MPVPLKGSTRTSPNGEKDSPVDAENTRQGSFKLAPAGKAR
jgi:hypothetical protein